MLPSPSPDDSPSPVSRRKAVTPGQGAPSIKPSVRHPSFLSSPITRRTTPTYIRSSALPAAANTRLTSPASSLLVIQTPAKNTLRFQAAQNSARRKINQGGRWSKEDQDTHAEILSRDTSWYGDLVLNKTVFKGWQREPSLSINSMIDNSYSDDSLRAEFNAFAQPDSVDGSFDLSPPKNLRREAAGLRTLEGDMADGSILSDNSADHSFDKGIHPSMHNMIAGEVDLDVSFDECIASEPTDSSRAVSRGGRRVRVTHETASNQGRASLSSNFQPQSYATPPGAPFSRASDQVGCVQALRLELERVTQERDRYKTERNYYMDECYKYQVMMGNLSSWAKDIGTHVIHSREWENKSLRAEAAIRVGIDSMSIDDVVAAGDA